MRKIEICELLEDCVQSDGSLNNISWYINWAVGDTFVTLDGDFTAEDLKAIAVHMENTKGESK